MGSSTSFLPGNDRADELAARGALLVPFVIPCSLSPHIFCICSCLFSDWKRAVSLKLLLSPYDWQNRGSFMQRQRTPVPGISHFILHCAAANSLRRSLFGDSLSLYDLWSRPWGVSQLLEPHGLPPCPHSSEGIW